MSNLTAEYDSADMYCYKCRDRGLTAEKDNAHLQAKIDSLMLEYCPEEMTQEQKDSWARHQVKIDG